MTRLSCHTCANPVLVEKYSPTHTSVQWLADAETACPEFARRAALGERSDGIPTCSALRDSIRRAAESGELRTDCERREPVPAHPFVEQEFLT